MTTLPASALRKAKKLTPLRIDFAPRSHCALSDAPLPQGRALLLEDGKGTIHAAHPALRPDAKAPDFVTPYLATSPVGPFNTRASIPQWPEYLEGAAMYLRLRYERLAALGAPDKHPGFMQFDYKELAETGELSIARKADAATTISRLAGGYYSYPVLGQAYALASLGFAAVNSGALNETARQRTQDIAAQALHAHAVSQKQADAVMFAARDWLGAEAPKLRTDALVGNYELQRLSRARRYG